MKGNYACAITMYNYKIPYILNAKKYRWQKRRHVVSDLVDLVRVAQLTLCSASYWISQQCNKSSFNQKEKNTFYCFIYLIKFFLSDVSLLNLSLNSDELEFFILHPIAISFHHDSLEISCKNTWIWKLLK